MSISKMDWRKLLSKKRLLSSGEEDKSSARSPFQRDFDRIAFSSAFRRLQDKAQVFPMAESDYVRTRLTHSLECACVAKSLGSIVGKEIIKRDELNGYLPSDFGEIVAAASLAHDIGNPLFGHAGEDAVVHWFKTSDYAQTLLGDLSPDERGDFELFEGNAQGFRILTRLQRPDNKGGMQLTCATLAAFMKYPTISSEVKKIKGVSFKKHGFFLSEHERFGVVADEVGLKPVTDFNGKAWHRHPLAFLSEAADDICYAIVDFEDGARLGHVPYTDAQESLLEIIPEIDRDDVIRELDAIKHGNKEKIECLRSRAINELIKQVTECFLQKEESILSGTFNEELTENIPAKFALKKILKRSKKDIYKAREVIKCGSQYLR